MESTLLSIVIPIYNVERYLTQCLDSVFSQEISESEYEVICVNDGSLDNSRQIVLDYKKKHSNLILIDRENGGLSAARNTGFRAAKGKYVYFLDSDDYLYQNSLSLFLGYSDSNLEMICFNALKEGEVPYFSEDIIIPLSSGVEFIRQFYNQVSFHYPAPVWLYLYKRDFLANYNLYNTEGILHEDEEFTPRCLFYAKNIKLDNRSIQYHRVMRDGAITSDFTNKHITSVIYIIRVLSKFYLKNKADRLFSTALIYLTLSCIRKSDNFNLISIWKRNIKLSDYIKLYQCCSSKFEKKIVKLMVINPILAAKYFYGNTLSIGKKNICKLI